MADSVGTGSYSTSCDPLTNNAVAPEKLEAPVGEAIVADSSIEMEDLLRTPKPAPAGQGPSSLEASSSAAPSLAASLSSSMANSGEPITEPNSVNPSVPLPSPHSPVEDTPQPATATCPSGGSELSPEKPPTPQTADR
eukprot:RCo004189